MAEEAHARRPGLPNPFAVLRASSTFVGDLPALAEQLTHSIGDLSGLIAEQVSATREQVAATREQVAATREQVAATREQVTETQAMRAETVALRRELTLMRESFDQVRDKIPAFRIRADGRGEPPLRSPGCPAARRPRTPEHDAARRTSGIRSSP